MLISAGKVRVWEDSHRAHVMEILQRASPELHGRAYSCVKDAIVNFCQNNPKSETARPTVREMTRVTWRQIGISRMEAQQRIVVQLMYRLIASGTISANGESGGNRWPAMPLHEQLAFPPYHLIQRLVSEVPPCQTPAPVLDAKAVLSWLFF